MTENSSTMDPHEASAVRADASRAAPTAERAKSKLLGLEFGRFVASLLVVFFHFSHAFMALRGDNQFLMVFRGGHAGVDYFFVLSGFIIYHVHRHDLGQPDKLKAFVLKRFIRLYPVYWLVFALMIALVLLSGPLGAKYDLEPFGRLLDGLLLPFDGKPLLGQSWTLRHEIVFYAVFAIAILNLRAGLVLFFAWQLGCLVIGSIYGATLNAYVKPFLYIYNIGFGAGIAVAWASERITLRRPALLMLVGIAGFVACLTVEAIIGHAIPGEQLPLGEVTSPILYISFASIAILGLTALEQRVTLPSPRLLTLLGGCSYALYLIHGILISVLMRAFTLGPLALIPNAVSLAIMILLCILAAIAVHLYVEKPILRHLRQILLPSPKSR